MLLHFHDKHAPEALTFSVVTSAVVPVQREACMLLHIHCAGAGLGRKVWFQKQQEGHLPDHGQGGKVLGLPAPGLWKTADLLVVQFGSVAFHSCSCFFSSSYNAITHLISYNKYLKVLKLLKVARRESGL